MKKFITEAFNRFKTLSVPKFFVKLQICGAFLLALGTQMKLVPWESMPFMYLNQYAASFFEIGGTIVLVCQFVQKGNVDEKGKLIDQNS